MKYFQFIVTPNNFEKPIKLQLPILLATYPLRNEDGTMRRKTKTEYPTTLPIFRPWLDEKNLWQSKSEGDHQQPPHTDTGPAWELASWPPSAVLGNLRPNETLCCKWCDDRIYKPVSNTRCEDSSPDLATMPRHATEWTLDSGKICRLLDYAQTMLERKWSNYPLGVSTSLELVISDLQQFIMWLHFFVTWKIVFEKSYVRAISDHNV